MVQVIRVDGLEYDADTLTQQGKEIVESLNFSRQILQDLNNQLALLTKAKNAYISDIRSEIVEGRSGVDLSSLLSED